MSAVREMAGTDHFQLALGSVCSQAKVQEEIRDLLNLVPKQIKDGERLQSALNMQTLLHHAQLRLYFIFLNLPVIYAGYV